MRQGGFVIRPAIANCEPAFLPAFLMDDQTPLLLNVPHLDEAIHFFTQRLGFRLEMIVPADAPHTAMLTGQGYVLRLESSQAEKVHSKGDQPFIVSQEQAWHTGRAGMQYRDLIPGRLNERFIASHIRIPEGGPVADDVHYHKVRFQMIYVKAGWVRVIYEDQGESLVMVAGDCVLQPPEIRHRVLESSAGLEVIEIGSPAIHETWIDHELILPNTQVQRERSFQGQRFVFHQMHKAQWRPWRIKGMVARDTGIAAATNGLAAVQVVKADERIVAAEQGHHDALRFWFVLQGELVLESESLDRRALESGDSCVIASEHDYVLRTGTGLEFLEVSYHANDL